MNKLKYKVDKILKNQLISVQINLLNECTSRCKSCRRYTWPKDKLGFEDVKRIVKFLHNKYEIESILFSGGDPVCYDELDKVIEYCGSLGVHTACITTLITEDEHIKDALAKTDRLFVSFDAFDKEKYKEVRGVDGSEVVKENLRSINVLRKKNGKEKIRLSMTVGRLNLDQVEKVYAFCKENDLNLNFYLLHTWDDLMMSNDDIDLFFGMMKKISEENYIVTNAGSFFEKEDQLKESFDCYIPRITCAINADGNVFPCCKLFDENNFYKDQLKYSYGNVLNEDMNEVFSRRLTIKYPLKCSNCKSCLPQYISPINFMDDLYKHKDDAIFM